MKRTNENIISGIGENDGVFFIFLAAFFLSFYLIGKINPNPHIPQIHLYPPQKNKNSPFQSREFTFK